MSARRSAQALLALGALGLTLALLALRLIAPPARAVDVGGPGDAYAAASFFAPEGAGEATFRWSGPNSALILPAHAAGGALLRMRAHGATAGQRLALYVPEAGAPATLTLDGGWRVYQLLVAAPRAPHRVELRADLVRPGADDPRELGVALDWVAWAPSPRGAGALPGALGDAALLAWALALVGAVALLVWPGAQGQAGAGDAAATGGGAWAALILMGSVGATLVAWAWLDLDGMRWLLALEPAPLAAATLALLALWGVTRVPPGGRARDMWRRVAGTPVRRAGLYALAIGLAHAALWAPLPGDWRGAAALAILWAPGWLAARALLRHEGDREMGLVLGASGALALQVCVALVAAVLPGGASGPSLLVLSDLISAALLAARWRQGSRAPREAPARGPAQGGKRLALTALVLLAAAALRLPALGGAELHDDEASVLLGAAELAQGDGEVLLRQLKGPDQIVLPAGPLALTGQLSERTARLPFAVAGLAVILGTMGLARGPLGAGGATAVAGAILALDGLLIAFARIVQYQSVVMLMGVAAFWCCWRFAQGGAGGRRYLAAAAVCAAVALLGHYDAVYVMPALALLVAAGARRRGWGPAEAARQLAPPTLLGAGLLLGFYVPFVLHPHFADTVGHVQERTGQGGGGWAGYNNLPVSYELLKVYNAAAQLWAVGLLLGAALAWALARLARRAAAAHRGAHGPPAQTAARWAALVWLVAAGGAMSFLIAQPRTHIYVAVIPAALLAALGARAIGGLGRPWRDPLLAAGALVALWAGLHQQVVFLRQSPEYVRGYPAARVAPLSGPAALALDPAARFGFPGRDGWKAVGELYRLGELRGAAASNQSSEVLAWYMGGRRRCGADPEVYLVALSAPNPSIPRDFVRTGAIQADGRDQILIYQRGPATQAPRVIPLEPFVAAFDERAIPPIAAAEKACQQ